jgi:hypothetical protein
MSRSSHNYKAARQLREAESLEIKKTIIKASGNNAFDKEEVFESLEASNANYLDRMQKLASFKSKSKAVSKKISRIMEWESEYLALEGSMSNVNKDLLNIMEVFVLHTLSDTDVQGIVQELQDIDVNISAYKQSLISQYREVKSIIGSVQSTEPGNKSHRKKPAIKTAALKVSQLEGGVVESDVDNDVVDDQATSTSGSPKYSEATCIAAELLLSIRHGHSQSGNHLAELEENYSQELLDSRRTLTSSWRGEMVESTNKSLNDLYSQLATASTEDSSKIEREQHEVLLLNEWCHKMKLLERNYELANKLVEAEKHSLCLELGIPLQSDEYIDSSGGDVAHESGGTDNNCGLGTVDTSASLVRGGWNKPDHLIFVKVSPYPMCPECRSWS